MIVYSELRNLQPKEQRELLALYCDAEWVDPEDPGDFLRKAAAGSTVFLVARDSEDNQRIVGCARAISDGVSDAYIQDVTVNRNYRKQGIGGELVRRVAAALQTRGIDWIALVGQPGTEHFYRELGFRAEPGHTLWKWQ